MGIERIYITMGFIKEYYGFKDLYSKEEIEDKFYHHYYYIVEKEYAHNNSIPKKEIESCLCQGINDFIRNSDKGSNPSKYIHSRISSLKKSYKSKKEKKEYFEILKKAFLGDYDARKYLFLIHIDKIDKRIINIYESYLDYNIINLDDIAYSLYQDMWIFVNRYFDCDNKGYYFSTRFTNQLCSSEKKVNRHIQKTIECKTKKKVRD